MRLLCVALVFAVLATCGPAHAAAPSPWIDDATPVFQHAPTVGLPYPAVYGVAQDRRGYIWVGTPGGLSRYDGYAFRNYIQTPQHPDAAPEAETLLADNDDGMWIGTMSSGLSHFDERSQTFHAFRPDARGRAGPRSATIIAMARASDGTLLLGGDAGLDTFDPTTNAFHPETLIAHAAQPRVEAITIDRRQTEWIGTLKGLFYRARGERAFHRLLPEAIFSLFEDTTGRMWFGSSNRVGIVDRTNRVVRTFTASPSSDSLIPGEQWGIIEPVPGTMWVGSGNGGIASIDLATDAIHRIVPDRGNPSGLSAGAIWAFLRDRSGLVWIADGSGGLLSYNPVNRGIYEISASTTAIDPAHFGARAIAVAPNGTMLLGDLNDVIAYDPQSNRATRYPLPNRGAIQSLFEDGAGTLWIGTFDGLCLLRAGAAAVECPSGFYHNVGRAISVYRAPNELWIGTAAGLIVRDDNSGRITRYHHGALHNAISNDFINALYRDRSGNMWVGTYNGLNRIDPSGRVTEFLHDPKDRQSIGAGSIGGILEDSRGRMWIGAVGGSLTVMSPHGKHYDYRNVGIADGLLTQDVDSIQQAPDGAIWASSINLMARIDPSTLAVSLLGPPEGVQESEYWTRASAQSADGTMYFAGSTGVTVIAPGASAPWTYHPPIEITSIRLGDRALAESLPARDATLVITPGSRDFSVEFSSLDYSAPEALRYEYKLDGYDDQWNPADASHRTATYTNLAPGSYVLELRGTNRDGIWSDNSAALNVSVDPAWFQTWWFRLLVGLLIAGALLEIYTLRTAVLRRRQQQLERVVALRTQELSDANTALAEMSLTDPLTGLRNRRFLEQHIETDIAATLRDKSDLLFFLVDIDHFKAVNDELGHRAGDLVLTQMRDRLNSVFRESDYVVRWGGEEFLAVARTSRREEAGEMAERIRRAIADTPFTLDDGSHLSKTGSIGFAAFPHDPLEPTAVRWQQIVSFADEAMYHVKTHGRNGWHGYP